MYYRLIQGLHIRPTLLKLYKVNDVAVNLLNSLNLATVVFEVIEENFCFWTSLENNSLSTADIQQLTVLFKK
jgi:hypothetical protein